jgi:hypothetical protein
MSNLQLGLAVLGGLLLAGLLAFNTWQARKSTPRKAADAPPSTQQNLTEPLPSEFRREPDLNLTEAENEASVASSIANDKGHLDKSDGTRNLYKKAGLNASIDAIAVLRLAAEVTGDALLAVMPGSRRVGSKPFAIEALHRSSREWESPRPGQRYTSVRVGVQRANRHGALNEIEFSEFVVKTQALGDALKATPEFPDMREEVARGRELDQFASTNDAQLGFTLRATQASWSPGYIHQCALVQGFLPGNLPGRMVLLSKLPDAGTAPVLTLAYDNHAVFADHPDREALREVSVLLDVAHVSPDEQPYQRMLDVIEALGQEMDGLVTDDAGQPLSQEAMALIGTDIDAMYDALAAAGLAAGSPLARRLFS